VASAREPLAWGKATRIGSQPLTAVSCAPGICVAGDRSGHMLSTRHPGGGSWRRTRRAVGGTLALSCPSASLCVGVDRDGIVSSASPAVGRWHRTQIGGPVELDALSCAPAEPPLCVAGGVNNSDSDVFQNAPEVAISANAPSGWATTNMNGSGAMTGLSCPSRSFCVGAGGGYAAVTKDPGDGRAATWLFDYVGGGVVLWADVACPSERLCVMVGNSGVAVSTDAGASWSVTWTKTALTHVACASERLCVAIARRRVLVSTDPAAGAWSRSTRGGGTGIACTSGSLCALVSARGTVRLAHVVAP
jgi:hypothetical protein